MEDFTSNDWAAVYMAVVWILTVITMVCYAFYDPCWFRENGWFAIGGIVVCGFPICGIVLIAFSVFCLAAVLTGLVFD